MTSNNFDGYGSINEAAAADEESNTSLSKAIPSSSCESPLAFKLQKVFAVILLGFLFACFAWMEPISTPHSSSEMTASMLTHTETASHQAPATKTHINNKHHHDPATPLFFDQIVDHNRVSTTSGTFSQRYYENRRYWKGAGHPIFLIFGGEGPLERILYPFISEVLAQEFGAITMNLEHR